jgi:hypothetical protein
MLTEADYRTREQDRVSVLLLDYQMARDDDRAVVTAQAAVFSIFTAGIALIGAAVTQTCAFKERPCTRVPDVLLAGLPLLPLCMCAFLLLFGMVGTLRAYYARGLESELREYAREPMRQLGELPPASYMGLTLELASMRRGRVGYRLLAAILLLSALLIFVGLTLYIALNVGMTARVAMLIGYGAALVLLFTETAAGSVGGRALYVRTAERFLSHGVDGALPLAHRRTDQALESDERSLVSYLLAPRPEDWVKALFAPGAFFVVAATLGRLDRVGDFLVLWFILEYLIYYARYQWNDARGAAEDAEHSERGSRGRLPLGRTADRQRNVLTSLAVALGRVLLAIGLGFAFGVGFEVLVLIALVFTVASVYEAVRESGAKAPEALELKRSPRTTALWILVGVGYAIRAGLGVLVAGLSIGDAATVLALAFFWSLGVMFVLLTWLLEATSYCRVRAKEPAEAPEGSEGIERPENVKALEDPNSWEAHESLGRKPHIAALLDYVRRGGEPLPTTKDKITKDDKGYCGNAHPLRAAGSPSAPWNLALAVAAALAGGLGLELASEGGDPIGAIAAVVLVIGSGTIAMAFLLRESSFRALVALGAGLALAVIGVAIDGWQGLALALPWLVTSMVYAVFTHSSYRELKAFGPKEIAHIAKELACGTLRAVMGSATWKHAGFDERWN